MEETEGNTEHRDDDHHHTAPLQKPCTVLRTFML